MGSAELPPSRPGVTPDAEVLRLLALIDERQREGFEAAERGEPTCAAPGRPSNAVGRVLSVVSERTRAGLAIRLTPAEVDVLKAAANGEPIPPHPYRAMWSFRIRHASKESTCFSCGAAIAREAEIAEWPMTQQWGHRECVEVLAAAEPPTPERRRQAAGRMMSMHRSRTRQAGG